MPAAKRKKDAHHPPAETPPADQSPLILTTSEAVARGYRNAHAQSQRRLGRKVWEAPSIHHLQRWCQAQWLQTWPDAQRLHGTQELLLWQQAIEEDGAAGDVLSKAALAREARTTARLAAQYLIDPARSPRYTDEQEAFARWHRRVHETMRQNSWITESEIPALLLEQVRKGEVLPPPHISVTGATTRLTPLERELLQALAAAGSSIDIQESQAARAAITATQHEDGESELRALARVLHDHLLPSMDADEPPPALLVLCADPDSQRGLIESAFKPVLAPWLLLPAEGTRPVPWRFSSGRGLDQDPLIAVALAICGLSEYDNGLDEISRVLMASVLWTPEQRELTARADFGLRDEGGTRFTLHALLSCLPTLLQPRFIAMRDIVHAMPRRALPSAWVAHFEQRLQSLGWPGDRALHSAAFQARESWTLALNAFSAMDAQSGAIAHAQATTWLREIVSNRGFEPRADHEQPVQIMSFEEGAGMPADAVFLVGASDDVLPGPARRHPLLATETLVACGVPGVTAASALEDARRLADCLIAQTGSLHLSYAVMDERGAERTPTSLFGLDIDWKTATSSAPTSAELAASTPLLQWPAIDPVPPVVDARAEGVFGGVKIFRDYVEAPFFAFCKYRLGIAALPEPVAGIPAYAQGNIIHAVLDEVWGELRTRDALIALTKEQLGERIDAPLDRALKKNLPPERFGRMLLQIERARLRDVILQWLEHEKRRVEAFEVIRREQRAALDFEGLALNLVLDRVDRVASRLGDERYLIIDYKTGRQAEVRGWKADKLHEPQLPLYASSVALDQLAIERVDGIAFAHIKDGHPALVPAINWGLGLIDEKQTFKMESWPEQLDAWRGALILIARGFLAGEAGIDDPDKYRRGINKDLLDLIREDL